MIPSEKDIDTVTRAVIDGYDEAWKKKLKAAGDDYYAIQRKVNEMMRIRKALRSFMAPQGD